MKKYAIMVAVALGAVAVANRIAPVKKLING